MNIVVQEEAQKTQSWLGTLPNGWASKRLKYISTINDETLPETTDPDYEILYVDIGSVDATEGIQKKEPMIFEAAPSRARRIVRDGDTIVSTVRTYLRAVTAIRNPEENLIVSTGFAVIRPKNINPNYLAYCLRSSYFIETVVSRSVGVSYPATNPTDVSCIELPLPPLDRQRAIARFLDAKTAQIDALVAQERLLIDKLKEKRQALIARTVTRGLPPEAAKVAGLEPNPEVKDSGVEWLGEIPIHWTAKAVRYVFRNCDSRRIPLSSEERADLEKLYPYYGASGVIDMVDNYLFDESLILVAEDGANLLSRSTPLAFLATGKYWVNNHAHILKPLSGDIRYWVATLETFDFSPLITGAAQPKLTADRLAGIRLPVPPTAEQTAIADYLTSKTSELDDLVVQAVTVIARLTEYRQALITSAVTGKIDVRGWESELEAA